MNLSKRMLKINSLVDPCSVVADVGCDHGKLGAELVISGRSKYAIFSDISELCLNKAKILSIETGIYKQCKFIECDGFSKFSPDIKIDCAIIAGMGGFEIANILLKKPKSVEVNKFVLQPNNNVIYLRRTLVQNGFKILEDEVIEEQGIFYNVLLVEAGKDVLSRDELEFGRTNLIKLSPEFIAYLEFKLSQLEAILPSIIGTDKESEITNLINQINNVLKGRKTNATRNK